MMPLVLINDALGLLAYKIRPIKGVSERRYFTLSKFTGRDLEINHLQHSTVVSTIPPKLFKVESICLSVKVKFLIRNLIDLARFKCHLLAKTLINPHHSLG